MFLTFWYADMQCSKNSAIRDFTPYSKGKKSSAFSSRVTIISTDYFWTLVILIHQDF